MKVVVFMAMSVNGFVARGNGEEDFLSDENWSQMLRFAKKYGNLIWGRKTYEKVISWGAPYVNDISKLQIVVVSGQKNLNYMANVKACSTLGEAISLVAGSGCKTSFVSGGPTLITSALSHGLVSDLVLNINPIVVDSSLPLFNGDTQDIGLTIKKVKKLKSGIVQISYEVQ